MRRGDCDRVWVRVCTRGYVSVHVCAEGIRAPVTGVNQRPPAKDRWKDRERRVKDRDTECYGVER